jgi:hypothetical protein
VNDTAQPGLLRNTWPAGLLVVGLGLFIVLASLGVIELQTVSRRKALFNDAREWQIAGFGLIFACAGLLLMIPQRAQALGRFAAMVFMLVVLVTASGTIWFASGGATRQKGGSMNAFLDSIAAWFSSFGIHPVLGAFIAGVLIAFVFAYRRNTEAGSGLEAGLAQARPGRQGGMFDSTSMRVENTNVSLTVNGKDTTLPPEVIAHLKKGDKIAAIKALREAAGLDLVEAKRLAEMLAESPLLRRPPGT